jgi:hypothetical protein
MYQERMMDDTKRLYKFLEQYQVKSNTDLHCRKEVNDFAKEIQSKLLGCALASNSRILSLAYMFRPFQVIVCIFSLWLLLLAIGSAYLAHAYSPLIGKYFKFVDEQLAFMPNLNANPIHLDILYDGRICRWPKAFYNMSFKGREFVYSFQHPVQITGWAYQDAKPHETGSQFSVLTQGLTDISSLNGGRLLSLHTSSDGVKWERIEVSWPQRWPAGRPGAVDLRPPVWWILHNVISPLGVALCSFASSLLGFRDNFGLKFETQIKMRLGPKLVSFGWLLSSATHLVACYLGAPPSVARSCLLSATYAALSFIEYGILEGCLLVCSLHLAMALYIFSSQSISTLEAETEAYQATGCAFLVSAIMVWRRKFTDALRHRVRRDREAFDAAFSRIQNDPALPRLQAACDDIGKMLQPVSDAVRQPTRRVSQLWDQATALQILLHSKAVSWALSSCGEIDPSREGPSAVELFALLDGDNALVFDYCAAGIVFEDVGCLTTCLKLVQADKSVRIVRVENRLCSAWSADREGGSGYRRVPFDVFLKTSRITTFFLLWISLSVAALPMIPFHVAGLLCRC